MKHFWKRLLAGALTAVMLVSVLPPTVLAALVDNTPDQNDEILQELTAFWGDEKTAQEATDLLRKYGLIDEEGNVLTDWSGEIYIHDGDEPRHTSVEELTALLEDETVSRDTVITVDGTEITLGGFETILEIQREIGRIRETYLQDEVPLNQEQAANLYSLYQQLSENGIQLYSTNGADELVFPSGVDHGVTLSVSAGDSASQNSTYTVTVTPDKAQNKEITFSWRALSGSASATGGGTVTIPAGSTAPVSLSVNVGKPQGKVNGKAVFLVQIYDVKNALINGSSQWGKSVTVTGSDTFKYKGEASATLSYDPAASNGYYLQMYDTFLTGIDVNEGNKSIHDSASTSTERTSKTLTVSGLSAGTYSGTLVIGSGTFSPCKVDTYKSNMSNSKLTDNDITKEHASYEIKVNGGSTKTGNLDALFNNTPVTVNESQNIKTTYTGSSNTAKYTVSVNTSVAKYSYYTYSSLLGSMLIFYLDFIPKINIPVKLTMQESTSKISADISAPAGSYYPGQSVPITVRFGFPMKITNSMTLTVNGQTMTPVEAGSTAEYCTFLYTVKRWTKHLPVMRMPA